MNLAHRDRLCAHEAECGFAYAAGYRGRLSALAGRLRSGYLIRPRHFIVVDALDRPRSRLLPREHVRLLRGHVGRAHCASGYGGCKLGITQAVEADHGQFPNSRRLTEVHSENV